MFESDDQSCDVLDWEGDVVVVEQGFGRLAGLYGVVVEDRGRDSIEQLLQERGARRPGIRFEDVSYQVHNGTHAGGGTENVEPEKIGRLSHVEGVQGDAGLRSLEGGGVD